MSKRKKRKEKIKEKKKKKIYSECCENKNAPVVQKEMNIWKRVNNARV